MDYGFVTLRLRPDLTVGQSSSSNLLYREIQIKLIWIRLDTTGLTNWIDKLSGLAAALQSCIKFKKFNSSSVHGIELSSQLKFSSFDKNWTWTAAQLTIELFWTELKVNSDRVECPLVEKRRNWAFSMSWHTKFCSSFPFLVGGTPLSLNWLWTQFKKVQWWVEQQFKFSFWSMNWIWIDHQVQGKNWIELRTSIQFWTAIQLWSERPFGANFYLFWAPQRL